MYIGIIMCVCVGGGVVVYEKQIEIFNLGFRMEELNSRDLSKKILNVNNRLH